MAKKTTVDIDGLKAALNELTSLSQDMGNSGGAAAYTADVGAIDQGIGPLLENAGGTIAKYVNARTTQLTTVHQEAVQAVGTAGTLLSSTITNYENNENAQRTAAEGTDTSGGTGGAGGGAGGAGGADQKG